MTIKDLIEKRAKVWETAKNFVETHEDKNGVLSEEDTATYNKMEKEIEDLTTAIDRQQRAERREAELRELFAGNGMVGFVAKERVDGKLILPEAVQVLKLKRDIAS